MRVRLFSAAVVTVLLTAVSPSAADASVLFSTLEQPNTVSGPNAAAAEVAGADTGAVAQSFSAARSGTPNLLALRAQTNANQQGGDTQGAIQVTLHPDAGGAPGPAVIGTYSGTATSLNGSSPICMARASGTGNLVAGQTYWAVLEPRQITTSWLAQNDTVRTVLTRTSAGGAWSSALNPNKLLALRVEDGTVCGPDVVPNPTPGAELGDMIARPGGTHWNTITLKNDGNQTLEITGASIGGADPGTFSLLQGEPGGVMGKPYEFPRSVGAHPDAVEIIYVACAGSGADGLRRATLTIRTNDTDEPTITYGLSCLIDGTPPTLEYSIAPNGSAGWFVGGPATFSIRGIDPESNNFVKRIFCSVGGVAEALDWRNGSIATFSFTADGIYALSCAGTDVANNTGTGSPAEVKVDRTAPQSSITTGPPSLTTATGATFVFSSSDAMSGPGTVQCRLGSAAFADCTSPSALSGLPDGLHTYEVRARDVAGNDDPTPAAHTWRVDTTAPTTAFTSTQPSPTAGSTAAFTAMGDDPDGSGVARLECSLDGVAFATCPDPLTFAGLTEGRHMLAVRAVDRAGNVDATPVEHAWDIDRTAPTATLTDTPPAASGVRAAAFGFGASGAGAAANERFECRLDGGVFATCTSPVALTDLGDEREHVFEVRAIDVLGNVQADPTVYRWSISTRPVAQNDAASTTQGAAVDVPVLANDTDPSAGGLTAVSASGTSDRGGTLTPTAAGLLYTPPAGFNGTDTFTYRARSAGGSESAPATVTIEVRALPPVAEQPLLSAASRDVLGPAAGGVAGAGGAGAGGSLAGAGRPDRFHPILSSVHVRRGRLSLRVGEAGTVRIGVRRLRWRRSGRAPEVVVTQAVPVGLTRIDLRGRLGKLGRGPYRFVMTVVDAAGNRSPEARRAFLLPLGGGRSG
jgi:hypothetical protein